MMPMQGMTAEQMMQLMAQGGGQMPGTAQAMQPDLGVAAAGPMGTAMGSGPMITPGQAALGSQAMANIGAAAGKAPQIPMAGNAGVAPRGQQVQLRDTVGQMNTIDPRIKAGLAALLFGGQH